jgi:uncharacterized protein
MKTVTLGRTNLVVPQLGFGALPIQRTEDATAVRILRKAYDGGIRFFDTARAYSDSERKLGAALADVRHDIVIATKTWAADARTAREHIEASLRDLKTDYIDIIQLHNPESMPDPADPSTAYAALVEAKREGLVRHIGLSNHRAGLAREAVPSGLFDTLQFPFSHISSPEDMAILDLCRRHNVGAIGMKALCGGLVTNIPAAYAFLTQYDNLVPIWGIQHEWELDQFLAMEKDPPALGPDLRQAIEDDRRDLAATFCRGCGYCLPCPADIPIPMAARMYHLLRRAPYQQFLTGDWPEKMRRIARCTECGSCAKKCPYGLDTPSLLKVMLADYEEFFAAHT